MGDNFGEIFDKNLREFDKDSTPRRSNPLVPAMLPVIVRLSPPTHLTAQVQVLNR